MPSGGETSGPSRPRSSLGPEGCSDEESGDAIMEEGEPARRSREEGYPDEESGPVPSSLAHVVAPILRAADEIEEENPRVAYLCRLTAWKKAHAMDPSASRRGVRRFKTELTRRLEKEKRETQGRLASNDAKEIYRFCEQYCRQNLEGLETRKPDETTKHHQIAHVLIDVLKTVSPENFHPEFDKYVKAVEKEKASFSCYNILPLNISGSTQPIMGIPEIKAAVDLCMKNNLPSPKRDPTSVLPTVHDLLDWLCQTFGFQKDNVANQKEHLILLLANIQMRKGRNTHRGERYNHVIQSNTVIYLMKKIFQNYISWCRHLDLESNIKIPKGARASTQQPELLYVGLYLLIWGEASNVRFMPECLCYIFHHMASDLYDIIGRGGSSDPLFLQDGRDDAFLRMVIQPIYNVIQKEAASSKNGTVSHTEWRNYDDLNEYFWSKKCFKQLGWPMDPRADFFAAAKKTENEIEQHDHVVSRWAMSKTNFVEVRTFLHLFRSFDRMWAFFILAFQAMVIIAWSPSASLSAIFEPAVFRNVLTIFITAAFLNFLQATLELFLNWKARRSLACSQMIRYILKFSVAIAWLIILPTTYSSSIEIPTCLVKLFDGWIGNSQSESIYSFVVALYMLPNIFSVLFFMFLPIRRAFERSNSLIVRFLLWWTQPKLYVARGMYEDTCSLLKYTSFWILLLICKLAFSYYVEITPLVGPTRTIMFLGRGDNTWHKFFPYLQHNLGVVITIWAPIIMVYFMDTQIWYAIFSTICGGLNNTFSRLGEIQTLGILKSRFEAIPRAFDKNLVPTHGSQSTRHELEEDKILHVDKFSDIWNAFINSLRDEDLISNRERYLLIFPSSIGDTTTFRWPLFLLGNKISSVLHMATSAEESDEELRRRINQDPYAYHAVKECYETSLYILRNLIQEPDKEVVDRIRESIEGSIHDQSVLKEFRLDGLLMLIYKFYKLLSLLLFKERGDGADDNIISLLQDIMEFITRDIMKTGQGVLKDVHTDNQLSANLNLELFYTEAWREKCVRLQSLLTIKESATYVPTNLEARRRITFFANSLFMKMPRAPQVRSMMSLSVLTPYFKEEVLFSAEDLRRKKDNGISILFLLRKIYPDEWNNFLERIDFRPIYEDSLKSRMEEVCWWASYKGHTLTRTVRGIMYYRTALEIQYIQDKTDIAKLDRHRTTSSPQEGSAIVDMARAIADIKFTYVVSCQAYGTQKISKYHHDKARYMKILNLMMMYPSLRVAYIDEVEAPTGNGTTNKTYYSVLVKGVDDKYDEEIYRIKLPGKPTNIGEEGAENKIHAIIFTRGEALQAIDMDQDFYLEEAFKMRNVLEEFGSEEYGKRKPTILGLNKHIFTESVSSPAWFMSNQESSFATIGQQVLANPLKVRFHYGHSDIFDRLFHITRGGISKASKTINLSEDIFSGFNSTMRDGNVTHHKYMQVGKGCDAGMNQISSFEAKVAIGNAEQTLSRDIYRLGCRFDFYRMLSLYFTTVGFYFSSMVTVLTVYVFLYGRLYLVMSGLEKSILLDPRIHGNFKPLDRALASQAVFQLGLMLVLPMFMEVGLEKGFCIALGEFVIMQLQLASVFFTFQLGTKTHYYGRTILHGGTKFRPTGRGFVVYHAKFAEIYRIYSRSHFVKGFELLILLVVYLAYGSSYHSSNLHLFVTFSIWILVASWLFAPFFFNPSCFEWQKTLDDWIDWRRWMGNRVGIAMHEESWDAWWIGEQEHLRKTSIRALLLEIILSLRFLIYQYVIVYHLNITRHSRSILVYALSWLVTLTVLVVLKIVSIGRHKFEDLLFLGSVPVMVVLFVVCKLTISDVFASILGFVPTGWCILLIAQACSQLLKKTILWDSIMELGRAYDYMMGLIIFLPIKLLSWFSFFSVIQTQFLFSQAMGKGLQISRILASQKDISKFE